MFRRVVYTFNPASMQSWSLHEEEGRSWKEAEVPTHNFTSLLANMLRQHCQASLYLVRCLLLWKPSCLHPGVCTRDPPPHLRPPHMYFYQAVAWSHSGKRREVKSACCSALAHNGCFFFFSCLFYFRPSCFHKHECCYKSHNLLLLPSFAAAWWFYPHLTGETRWCTRQSKVYFLLGASNQNAKCSVNSHLHSCQKHQTHLSPVKSLIRVSFWLYDSW